jgi:hypothetical protein
MAANLPDDNPCDWLWPSLVALLVFALLVLGCGGGCRMDCHMKSVPTDRKDQP